MEDEVRGEGVPAEGTGWHADRDMRGESPWRTLDAREVYRNPWITVTEYSVVRPDGTRGIYGVVDPGHNATIVPLDADGGVWLAEEYVYPVQGYTWKVAGGKVEAGEEPLAAARRELLEEMGVTAGRWTELGAYYLTSGISPQTSYLYLARDLTIGEARREGTEHMTLRKMPLREAVAACLSGEVRDAPTALALLRAWLLLEQEAGRLVV